MLIKIWSGFQHCKNDVKTGYIPLKLFLVRKTKKCIEASSGSVDSKLWKS